MRLERIIDNEMTMGICDDPARTHAAASPQLHQRQVHCCAGDRKHAPSSIVFVRNRDDFDGIVSD